MSPTTMQEDHLPHTFGLWSGISVGWLTLNVFGGLSFILFVSLSAGGTPALLYGFIGSTVCVFCIILVFAQCASRFSTASGAYHYERGESNTTDWSCSVPIVELIGLATGSDASAVLSCLILIIKNGTSALRSDIAMSRQGYAFSRDGGLFWNERSAGYATSSLDKVSDIS
ncbi:hypothetical protein BGZ61DRAFT_479377 [Ilyonectria robusta]|uniref:uncharacterized protein n=1 Tax=Ilyonectria robusta TaxID=1079257 RepID=UPI001E8EE3B7|nr:uncharacterized protein BGZ61DRAFT_479377 [Ilyonectria robusta]KAH8686262.1 hypothetical protein BGZ61DRAFT_479377 [Ilyonectria robusta]